VLAYQVSVLNLEFWELVLCLSGVMDIQAFPKVVTRVDHQV
jgi:hypothetical protein